MTNQSVAYNLGPAGEIDLEMWLEGPSARCLFVQLPVTRRIGEEEFLLDLARRRKERRGFRDAIGRHFVSRRFGVEGSALDAAAMFAQARVAAEVTDEFYGVDAIDLTEWVGMPKMGERWQAFVRHIQTSPHTDFVFLVRTCNDNNVADLASVITGTGYLIADTIKLYPPTGEMLAEAFVDAATEDLEDGFDRAREMFDSLLASGAEPNYTLALDLAGRASVEARRGLEPEGAVTAAFASRGITQANRR